MSRPSGLEAEVKTLGRRIAELGEGERSRVYRMSWWSERMLDWAMDRPDFKTQLFRFVDVFPATIDDDDVARHLAEYFDGVDVPKALDLGIDIAGHVPFGRSVEAVVARRNIKRMARQFIVGETAAEAVRNLHQVWRTGTAFTCDLLGEKTVVAAEADRYAARVDELLRALVDAADGWAPDDHLEFDDLGPLPRVNISVKPTALAAHYEPLTREEGIAQAMARLRPILRLAGESGAFVHLDMEHYDVKDLTMQVLVDLLAEDEFGDADVGIVVQAYLKDSYADLRDLVALSSQRAVPLTVRLVKGAYWDTETVNAQAAGWPVPVYEDKDETDANYERCVRLLHDHHGEVRAAFGSHNIRSLAYAAAYARSVGIADTGYEVQMLYGMAEPVHAAIRRLGLRLRVYAPVGDLVPGMAYLVRRLLENTSNESFVRHRFAEGRALDDLLGQPGVEAIPEPAAADLRPPTDPAGPSAYEPEPVREWRRAGVRAEFAVAVDEVSARGTEEVPLVIGGTSVRTPETIDSVDPADPDTVVAQSAAAAPDDVDAAVAAARDGVAEWGRWPAADRAGVLFRTAAWMRERRDRLAAVQVREAGKPWDQADADVCEAIDFCEYYGRQMLALELRDAVQSPPGEANHLRYGPKGVGAVIAPWNFPLAIATGMTVAGLAAGNAVILKPAEQTPLTARSLVEALLTSGLPPGAIGFLPGDGAVAGAALVAHPDVAYVAFTGSLAVGLEINRVAAEVRPGQRHVKRVIAEMGGKNALIVDADSDPDQAVPAAVASAFGFAGQKCSAASRLIVHEAVYDDVVARLAAATEELIVGSPRERATQVGPLIDAEARDRVLGYLDRAGAEGTVVARHAAAPATGYFAPPAVVADLDPGSPVACEEVFGPLLAVFRAPDLDAAVRLANDTPFGLTAGIFSRSPVHIRRAVAGLRAGNVYVNRSITGAVVGRQPFGGVGLSGVGSKAGGPDYLLQFLDPKAVSENTLRQGFAGSGTS